MPLRAALEELQGYITPSASRKRAATVTSAEGRPDAGCETAGLFDRWPLIRVLIELSKSWNL